MKIQNSLVVAALVGSMTLEEVVKAHRHHNYHTATRPNYHNSYVYMGDDDFADTFDGTMATTLPDG
jgi:hypothetical protein